MFTPCKEDEDGAIELELEEIPNDCLEFQPTVKPISSKIFLNVDF